MHLKVTLNDGNVLLRKVGSMKEGEMQATRFIHDGIKDSKRDDQGVSYLVIYPAAQVAKVEVIKGAK